MIMGDNNTPLHLAARGDHTGIAELLLKNGALIGKTTVPRCTL